MESITIRQIPSEIKRRLRLRAARNGRSMEMELREIIRAALSVEEDLKMNLADKIHARFAKLDITEMVAPERTGIRLPPQFE